MPSILKDPQLARMKGSGIFVGLERQIEPYDRSMRTINERLQPRNFLFDKTDVTSQVPVVGAS